MLWWFLPKIQKELPFVKYLSLCGTVLSVSVLFFLQIFVCFFLLSQSDRLIDYLSFAEEIDYNIISLPEE